MCKSIKNDDRTKMGSGKATTESVISVSSRRRSISAEDPHAASSVSFDDSYNDSSDESYPYFPRPAAASSSSSEKCRKLQLKQPHQHIVAHHDYHDHGSDPPANMCDSPRKFSKHQHSSDMTSSSSKIGTITAFPVKLHDMLEQMEDESLSHVISWQPHGRCFVVHQAAAFKQLLPNFFKLSKIASFQRQLNLYGFQRITVGPDKGSYYHELYLRGRLDLAVCIARVKVKGTGVRAKANPDEEPNFYLYPPIEKVVAASTVLADPVESSSSRRVSLPQAILSSDVVPRKFQSLDDKTGKEELDPVKYTEWKYDTLRNSKGVARNLSSLDAFTEDPPGTDSLACRNFSVIEEWPDEPEWLLDDARDVPMVEANVSFDRVVDEMFGRDQSLKFRDLLKLAAV